MYRGQGWPGLDISRSGGPKLNVSRSDVARVRCIEIRGGQALKKKTHRWPGGRPGPGQGAGRPPLAPATSFSITNIRVVYIFT